MAARRIYYTTICFLAGAMLALTFFTATPPTEALSTTEEEQIEDIITTFASEPELGMTLLEDLAEESPGLAVLAILELARRDPENAVMAIVNLAETNPEVTVRGLMAIAEASQELAETQPQLAAALYAVLSESIIEMIETAPDVAAVAVQSIKQVAADIGDSLEEETVAAGLESDYLLAASPIMP